jgi:hypothetical protein
LPRILDLAEGAAMTFSIACAEKMNAITDHYNAAIVETVAYELQMAESKQSVATCHQKQNGIN